MPLKNFFFLRTMAVLMALCLSPAVMADSLPPAVAAALRSAGVPAAAVAVEVQEIGAPDPLLRLAGAEPVNPASVMKLLTTFSALEILGPAYRWRTEAWLDGDLKDGVLAGDLVLKGGGDPRLSIEAFWLFLQQMRDRGLRDIRGNLALDHGRFNVGGVDPAAFDGDAVSPYNVVPDALLLNYKAVRFTLVPIDGAARPLVLPTPRLAQMQIDNRITLTDGACGEWRDELQAEVKEGGRLVLSGPYPRACGEQTWNLGLYGHTDFVGGAFRQLWAELGGSLAGRVQDGRAAPAARLFAVNESPPLAEVIRDINKYSNNVMARQLFLTLGAEGLADKTRPATPADGDAAVRAWLEKKKLAMPELVLENGSGLSRRERISVDSLSRLLQLAWQSPLMPEFVASLPVEAVDGTMRKRLADSGVAGQAHIKTGSLSNVKSMAGYVQARDGRRYSVVFVATHPKAAATKPAQDALLEWVWAGAK